MFLSAIFAFIQSKGLIRTVVEVLYEVATAYARHNGDVHEVVQDASIVIREKLGTDSDVSHIIEHTVGLVDAIKSIRTPKVFKEGMAPSMEG